MGLFKGISDALLGPDQFAVALNDRQKTVVARGRSRKRLEGSRKAWNDEVGYYAPGRGDFQYGSATGANIVPLSDLPYNAHQ